jgi:hypothetical protein
MLLATERARVAQLGVVPAEQAAALFVRGLGEDAEVFAEAAGELIATA